MLNKLKVKILNQPFNLLLVTAILLMALSFLTWGQSTDIHLHDSYFVFSTILPVWASSIIIFLVWLIYQLTRKILWKRFLTWFHVIVTIFIFILLLAGIFWYDTLISPMKGDYLSYETFQADR